MNILPFQGRRYNLTKIDRLDDVISPPYDQYKEGLDDYLYQRHPYNIARIIMNKQTPQDTPDENRYTRSKAILDQWIGEGVFVQDAIPSIYPYFQDYRDGGQPTMTRKGFVALGEVTDYSQGIVLPHERTLSKPKQDRLNLLRSTLADTGLVFVLYSDPEGKVELLLDSITRRPYDMAAVDLNRDMNRLWRVDDTVAIEEIRRLMKDKSVIIADGHHRYEVALAFHQEIAPRTANDKRWDLYGYKLMSFVRLESEGITIFPIHRLIHSLRNFSAADFLVSLGAYFDIEEFSFTEDNKFSVLETLMGRLKKQQSTGQNAFGLYVPALQKFCLLKFRKEASERISWPSKKTKTWQGLDIAVLQVVVLENLLGIADKQLLEQTNIEYVSRHTDAIRLTDSKSYQCAFLLNPTLIQQVKEVVEAGDLLPQKSTHFHPKMMEGLVFAKHI
jgi:uncharacterized protein (DUF1015 family)